ncbi:cytochrome P450 [Streptomyces sp. NPDC020875]|uniref:cytochrome P450 n=1 Tax=Streptomyces sp. NPDC020875 TaxID=3154898 RepID=UPI0033FF63C9
MVSDYATRPAASSDLDLFSDKVLADPHPFYEALRATGPAVRLERHGVWAIPRHADAAAVLHDTAAFRSEGGLALTGLANDVLLAGTVLAADGDRHARLRRVLSRQLAPRAARGLAQEITARADRLADQHLNNPGGVFDAVHLARDLVTGTVMSLMGLPPGHEQTVIDGAGATFNAFGPSNPRYQAALPQATAMVTFLHEHVTRDTVTPGSWMGAIFDAVDARQIQECDAVPLAAAYTAASMDTTIYGIAEMLVQLARHPAQWDALRANVDGLAEAAFHEALRYEAPIQGFGRIVTRPADIGGTRIDAGEQVWLLYGSAGRDLERWGPDADQYNLHRPGNGHHLAFGHGPHLCAGIPLALLQATALLHALATGCTRLTLADEPTRLVHNILRGWQRAPIRPTPARDRS